MLSKSTLSVLVLSYAVELWFIHLISRHGDFLRAGEASAFVLSGFGAGLVFWSAVVCLLRAQLSVRQSAWVFWIGAILLRLFILPVFPGDDLWRYQWEGRIQLHGFNPYLLSPDSPVLAHLRDADWIKINHRDLSGDLSPARASVFRRDGALRKFRLALQAPIRTGRPCVLWHAPVAAPACGHRRSASRLVCLESSRGLRVRGGRALRLLDGPGAARGGLGRWMPTGAIFRV